MRKGMVLALACAVLLAACGDDYSSSGGGGGGGTTGSDSVRVTNNKFTPTSVMADSTGTVVWSWNGGGASHNVTFEDAITGSGDKTTGTFTHTFVAPGTYRYRCTIHSSSFSSGMRGEVVVE